MNQYAGLARAGPGQHAHVGRRRADGFALGIIETVENFRDIIHGRDCTQSTLPTVQVSLLA